MSIISDACRSFLTILSNELNAAYAADGYARVKEHSIGVVLTTYAYICLLLYSVLIHSSSFGVGELSAINGIAGGELSRFILVSCLNVLVAFSEMVPVLHIAGVPSTKQQKAKPMLHHTLGDGRSVFELAHRLNNIKVTPRYNAYIKAAEQFAIAQAILENKSTAAAEIDRVLSECISHARPVYLTLPTDLVYEKVSSDRLSIPLSRLPPPNDAETEAFVLDEIVKLVDQAKGDAIILVDACGIRHDARVETNELIKATGFPVYSAPMGKTAVSENYERYGGVCTSTTSVSTC